VRRLGFLLLCATALSLLACGEGSYRVVLRYPDQGAYDRAQGVEIFVGEGLNCDELRAGGLSPRVRFQAHEATPALGEIEVGFTAFIADVRDGSCQHFLSGCVETRLEAGIETEIRVLLEPFSGPTCGGAQRCQSGLCVSADAGATDALASDGTSTDTATGADAVAGDAAGGDASSVDRASLVEAGADDGQGLDGAAEASVGEDGSPVDSSGNDSVPADVSAGDSATADSGVADVAASDAAVPDTLIACTPDTFSCQGDLLIDCDSSGIGSATDCAPHGCNAGAATPRCNDCSPEASGCNDGDPCSHSDTCSDGLCVGTPYTCADTDPCADLTCDGLGSCDVSHTFDPCDDYSPCTDDDVCDGAGSCGGTPWVICGPQPLARYWINEAASGQAVTELVDDTEAPVNLTIAYPSAALMHFQEGAGGDRHLRFYGDQNGLDTGAARADIAGTKLAALHGATQVTIEVKYMVEACTDWQHRILGLGDGNGSSNGWLTVREYGSADNLIVTWASATDTLARFNHAPDCPIDTAAVVHWVVDTSQPTETERVRTYINGARAPLTLHAGDWPLENDTIDLGGGTQRIHLGGPHNGARTARTRIYFAAIYDQVLDDAWIFHNAAKLLADDDGPSHRGVVVKSIGASSRDFATMQAWEDARGALLTSRHVLAIESPSGTFTPGEQVSGGGCSGTYVAEDEAVSNDFLMTLDDFAGGCTAGTTLTGATASADLQTLLITGGTVERGEAYADQVLDEFILVDGADVDVDHFMWLSAGPGQKHAGVAGSGVVIDPSASGHVVHLHDAHTRIEWLEITDWPNFSGFNSYEAVHVSADQVLLQHLIIHDDAWGAGVTPTTSNPNSDAINLNSLQDGESITIRDSIIYNIGRGGILRQDEGSGDPTVNVTVENTTIYNCATSGSQADGTGNFAISEPNFVVSAVNVLSMDSCGSASCSSPTLDFENRGTWASFSNCMSSDDMASGTASHINMSSADQFVSTAAGAEDLHLLPTADAADNGLDLPGPTRLDIDRQGHPANTSWDIGADEVY